MSASGQTYQGTIDLASVRFLGTLSEVEDRLRALMGMDVVVTDRNGEPHVVGIVTSYKIESWP